MKASIQSPDGKLFPSSANALVVDSFYGLPPSWRWSVGIADKEGGYSELRCGNDAMSSDQWKSWTTEGDDSYVLACAAANLGLTIA